MTTTTTATIATPATLASNSNHDSGHPFNKGFLMNPTTTALQHSTTATIAPRNSKLCHDSHLREVFIYKKTKMCTMTKILTQVYFSLVGFLPERCCLFVFFLFFNVLVAYSFILIYKISCKHFFRKMVVRKHTGRMFLYRHLT